MGQPLVYLRKLFEKKLPEQISKDIVSKEYRITSTLPENSFSSTYNFVVVLSFSSFCLVVIFVLRSRKLRLMTVRDLPH
jgi:presenilin-like A22 family membrane protease